MHIQMLLPARLVAGSFLFPGDYWEHKGSEFKTIVAFNVTKWLSCGEDFAMFGL